VQSLESIHGPYAPNGMFAPQHDDPPSLRQGDIIASVFFPLTRPGLLRYLATYASGSETGIRLEPFIEVPQGSKKNYAQAISHGVVAHGAVISQCCDLDRKHPKSTFSLCRLILFEPARYKNVEALVNNIDPWGAENPHYQFFYLGQIDGLDGEYLADYGLLTSLGWVDYNVILTKKVHQLDDVNRNKFRVKVGAFFGRPPEEDRLAGLANPYEPTTPVIPTLIERIKTFFRR
jgi:hypothetical protein